MKSWKPILLLVLVFVAGVATGVLGNRISVRREVQQALKSPEKTQLIMERSLIRRLNLDAGQQAQLHTIMTETRTKLRELRREFQPQTSAIMQDSTAKISALLTPEQRVQYEKIRQEERPASRPPRPKP
jgi:Spy/CpxP family protein refolding chaperone